MIPGIISAPSKVVKFTKGSEPNLGNLSPKPLVYCIIYTYSVQYPHTHTHTRTAQYSLCCCTVLYTVQYRYFALAGPKMYNVILHARVYDSSSLPYCTAVLMAVLVPGTLG
jgi:hypothetical protein